MADESGDSGRNAALIVAVGVIGVVVILAVAVVGAAIAGSLVLAPDGDPAVPTVSITVEATENGITVSHDGGDAIRSDRLHVVVDGDRRTVWADAAEGDDEVTEGDQITVDGVAYGAAVRVEWRFEEERIPVAETTVQRA
ncbi:type IV pilin [Halosimplex aquaticum]|uniref:Type IV pilin n=1 Tax=Halosimplex aquaticum TaxID=3026162 RepID=A0ABD5Y635_9EURY|nr:type IV pilin [Halosimplex aquaticum]